MWLYWDTIQVTERFTLNEAMFTRSETEIRPVNFNIASMVDGQNGSGTHFARQSHRHN